MRFGKIILLVLGLSLVAYAADSPFTGKWKLNVEKSKFDPGPAPKSETITVSDDGKVTVEQTDASGNSITWSYTGEEGKEVAITGMGSEATVVVKQSGNHVEHSWKIAGQAATGVGDVSQDGKIMTYHYRGIAPDGKPSNELLVFDREP